VRSIHVFNIVPNQVSDYTHSVTYTQLSVVN